MNENENENDKKLDNGCLWKREEIRRKKKKSGNRTTHDEAHERSIDGNERQRKGCQREQRHVKVSKSRRHRAMRAQG